MANIFGCGEISQCFLDKGDDRWICETCQEDNESSEEEESEEEHYAECETCDKKLYDEGQEGDSLLDVLRTGQELAQSLPSRQPSLP